MNGGTILFVCNLLLFLLLAVGLFLETSKRSESAKKHFVYMHTHTVHICVLILTVLSFLIFLLDCIGVLPSSGYRFLSIGSVIVGLITFGTIWLRKRKKDAIPGFAFALRALTVSLALELFVFNFNSAHLLGGDYSQKQLDFNTAVTENFDVTSGKNIAEGNSVLEWKGVNIPVGTLTIDGISSKKSTANFSVDITDETNSGNYRSGIASVQVIKEYTRSQTIPCNFSGTVYDLRISFQTEEDETITVQSISVNDPIMLHFSIIRFLIMVVGSLIVYALSSSQFLRKEYAEKRGTVKICAWVLTGVLIGISLFMTNMSRYTDDSHSLKKDFQLTWGNQITQEIVDAFESGRTDLDIEMNETLLQLENPYDWSQRDDIGSYPWDHLLFEGKYYSYYGIAPVITLFLPYHKLTGYYFPTSWAIWLFGVLGIFFLTKFYLCFVDKFFRKTYASLILIGLAMIQFSCGIYFCYVYFNFYEIAQACGFLWVTSGAYFLMSSNVIGDGQIKYWRLVAAAACLSFGVLSRPTLAIYCVAALLFIYAGFRKKKTLYQQGKKWKYYLPYFTCALLPFVLIGSIQIWYNCARFGNPFDFGIQYSLTINDFTKSQYHTHFALIGFFNFLFRTPVFGEKFPFFTAESALTFSPQGYYFLATTGALGLIWRALPLAAYGKSLKAYRTVQNPNRNLYALMLLAVCVICPFIIIFSIWESGFATRYSVDFAWQMILGALIICFLVHQNCAENTKKHLNSLMIFAGALSLFMNFVHIYSYYIPTNSYSMEWQEKAFAFARLFEFWR